MLGTEIITCPNPACNKRIAVFAEAEGNECEHCGAQITDLKYEGEGVSFSYHQPTEFVMDHEYNISEGLEEEFPLDPEWESHLENCDGCPSCNPTAFRD